MAGAGTNRAKKTAVACAIWICVALACSTACPAAFAQGGNIEPIRVGSEQVVVPVYVADKERRSVATAKLGMNDFHLLEDGQEQRIQTLAVEHMHIWEVDDNLGRHIEYSNTPQGKWSTADLSFTSFAGVDPTSVYLIGYQPPPSAIGSCHHIEVRLDRRDALVYSRSEYCNVLHPPSDPLDGTKFGGELERDLASGANGQIHVAVQARAFDGGQPRVYVALDFPWESLDRRWVNGSLSATIGILGEVVRKDGSIAARFSDQACCSSDVPSFVVNEQRLEAHPEFDVMLIPNRYETELAVAPGEYEIRVALSDGKKFGRAVAPLNVESHDGQGLAVSQIMLGTEYHDVSATARSAALFPSQYAPIVSKGLEITPAATMHFKSNQLLVAYFEIYESPPGTAQGGIVEGHLKIVNPKNGKTVAELEPVKAGTDADSRNGGIPIAQFIPVKNLPKGEYVLEVKASDAAKKVTVERETNFVLDR